MITETTDISHGCKWVPAGALVALALLLTPYLSPWGAMWALALGLFWGAKWVSIQGVFWSGHSVRPGRVLAYALLWPGMDARAFCSQDSALSPKVYEWVFAMAKTGLGAGILWIGVPRMGTGHQLLTGWTGMIALVLLVHFGIFHLLSLFWREREIHAPPIMQSPLLAPSLSQFWSRGWNTAFTDLMHDHLLKPLARRFGSVGGILGIFVVSGFLHELVISVPARGGYGLPTLYFITQGLGVLFERSALGRRLGLRSGWKGWCFVALIAGGPAFWLFPPPFIYRVILPMLHAIGVT